MERYISLSSLSLLSLLDSLDEGSEGSEVASVPSVSEPGTGVVRTVAIRRGAGRQFSGIGGEKTGVLWRRPV